MLMGNVGEFLLEYTYPHLNLWDDFSWWKGFLFAASVLYLFDFILELYSNIIFVEFVKVDAFKFKVIPKLIFVTCIIGTYIFYTLDYDYTIAVYEGIHIDVIGDFLIKNLIQFSFIFLTVPFLFLLCMTIGYLIRWIIEGPKINRKNKKLEDLLQYAESEGRICPKFDKWWSMLCRVEYKNRNIPLFFNNKWDSTSSSEKALILKEQIKSAHKQDCKSFYHFKPLVLDGMDTYLRDLNKEDWCYDNE